MVSLWEETWHNFLLSRSDQQGGKLFIIPAENHSLVTEDWWSSGVKGHEAWGASPSFNDEGDDDERTEWDFC